MERQITVDTVLTYHNLHTVPRQAAVGLLVVCGCVWKRGVQVNKAVTPKLTWQWLADQGSGLGHGGGVVHVLDGEKDTVFTYRR